MLNTNKHVMQIDESDCGIAAFSTILKHFKINIPYHRLKLKFNDKINDISMYDILSVSNTIGVQGTGMKGNMNDLLNSQDLTFPFIAHVLNISNMHHFIVIQKISKNKIYVFDPGIGKYNLTFEEFNEIWTGNIMLFQKNNDYIPFEKEHVIKDSVKILFPYINKILIAIFYSLLISIISIFSINLYKVIIDDYVIQRKLFDTSITDFYKIVIILVLLYVSQTVLLYLKDNTLLNAALKLEFNIKEKFHRKINELPISITRNKTTGELLTRLDDIEYISEFLSNTFLNVVINIVTGILGAALLIRINIYLFLLVIAIVFFYLLFSIILIPKISYLSRIKIEKNSQVISIFKENIDGLEFIKTLLQEKNMTRKLNEINYSYVHSKKQLAYVTIFFNNCINILEQFGMLAVLVVGSYLIYLGQLTIGQMLAFESLMIFFIFPFKALVNVQIEYQQYKISYYRLLELMEVGSEKYLSEPIEKNFILDSLIVDNVSYSYSEAQIFKNISFKLYEGEKVFLSGKNGSGKSTMGKILIGMLKPEEGNIFLDGNNYDKLSVSYIRNKIVYIPQNPILFSGTLKDNILFDDGEEEELTKIIMMGMFDDLMSYMELGLDSYISESGNNLSGGQKQLICIVRALVRKPKIIIFDESTSQMDENIEEILLNYVDSIMELSCIFISHEEQLKKRYSKTICM